MITDKQTDFVYFSELLKTKYNSEYTALVTLLNDHNIKHGLLIGTKDIWCRDYMPIQVDTNKFVQFKYEPSYLNDSSEHKALISNTRIVCKANNLNPTFSQVNIDGGNIVKSNGKVILTDRIFEENSEFSDVYVLKRLEDLLESEVIIIPQINSDMTGHADGLVRFYDPDTLLVNELENEFKYWQKKMLKTIKENHFNYLEIPWFHDTRKDMKQKYPDSAIGLYVNFLEVKNIIIIPKFEITGNRDEEAFTFFQKHYPDRVIKQININNIAKHGGLLNCLSWNILGEKF